MAAACLQCWALFLGAHTYTIEYKRTKLHGNADGLSNLPQSFSGKVSDPALTLHMLQMEPLLVTSAQISNETRNDPLLFHQKRPTYRVSRMCHVGITSNCTPQTATQSS